MEVGRNEEACKRIRDCSSCRNGAKMCYQHSISYLFPLIKFKNDTSGKFHENDYVPEIRIPVRVEEDPTESNEIGEEEEGIDEKATEFDDEEDGIDEEATKIDDEDDGGFVGEVADELNGREVDAEECTQGVCENVDERNGKGMEVDGEEEGIEGVGKKGFVGEIGDELNGRGVDPKECTQGVCENVDERNERVAKNFSSSKTRVILRKIMRQRREGYDNDRKIAKKKWYKCGNVDFQRLQGELDQCENQYEKKIQELQQANDMKLRAENEEEEEGREDDENHNEIQELLQANDTNSRAENEEGREDDNNHFEIQELQQANDTNLRAENEEEQGGGREDDKKVKGNGRKRKGKEAGEGTPVVCGNSAEKDGDQGTSEMPKKSTTRAPSVAKKQKMYKAYDENGVKMDSNSEVAEKGDEFVGRRRRRGIKHNYTEENEVMREYFENDVLVLKRRKRGKKAEAKPKEEAKTKEEAEEGGGGEDDKKVKGNGRKRKRKEAGEGTPGVCENGAEKDGDQGTSERPRRSTTKTPSLTKKQKMDKAYDANGVKMDSNMCHQCQRNDKGRVVRCTNCKTKRFCIPCIGNWYPRMTEEQIAQACPVCLGNCNCKSCLRMDVTIKHLKTDEQWEEFLKAEKLEHSKILLKTVLPFLKQFNEEQVKEKEAEAKIQGMLVSEVNPEKATCSINKRVFCNYCRTSIVDFHRSCPKCTYDLCLSCCCDIRAGNLQSREEIFVEYFDGGYEYLHGEKEENIEGKNDGTQPGITRHYCDLSKNKAEGKELPSLPSDGKSKKKSEWKADEKGNIPCPPSEYGGCGEGVLKLNSFLSDGHVSSLLEQAEQIVAKWKQEDLPEEPNNCFPDIAMNADPGTNMRKCASRESSNDNYIYCPDVTVIQHTDFQLFQQHWTRGEPVIVRNVLQTSLGLSWEPMVMWRAVRQIRNTKHSTLLDVKALDCLNWCEVDVNLRKFFEGYLTGDFDPYGWPVILKLNDRSDTVEFEKQLPRHGAEFISALPFKEYTHPRYGTLNLASKWPNTTVKPDLGPKTYIAYGFPEELGRGDSVTKLHCNMSDSINILAHTAEVTVSTEKLKAISRLKQQHFAQDQEEIFGSGLYKESEREQVGSENGIGNDTSAPMSDILGASVYEGGGALWDIFRREDSPKLQDYLRVHYRKFRHVHCNPLKQVIHPIHDQTFYLTEEHKRRLKEEYGIEAWTFLQNLGEAVFIPAGCPHQVRNLKSCINVALDFVSPENFDECIRLAEEFRTLPENHRTKEDKLEVKKMTLYAVKQAIKDLVPYEKTGPSF